MDDLIMLLVMLVFALIGMCISFICDLVEKIRNYERPPKPVPPSQWNIPEDDWDERITRG